MRWLEVGKRRGQINMVKWACYRAPDENQGNSLLYKLSVRWEIEEMLGRGVDEDSGMIMASQASGSERVSPERERGPRWGEAVADGC